MAEWQKGGGKEGWDGEGSEWGSEESESEGNEEKRRKMEGEGILEVIKKMGEESNRRIEGLYDRMERGLEKVKGEIKGEIGEIKEMWQEWEGRWKEEKEKIWGKLEEIERGKQEDTKEIRKVVDDLGVRMETLEKRKQNEKGGAGGREGEWVRKVEELGRKMEQMEREKRKGNVVIKGMKMERNEGRQGAEKLFKDIGATVEVKEIKGVGEAEDGKMRVWVVELGDEGQKKEIMKLKNRLKGREERIYEDRTPEERRVRWLLERKAGEERGRGRMVRMGKDSVWIDGEKWVVMDDAMEVVKEREKWGFGKEGRSEGGR